MIKIVLVLYVLVFSKYYMSKIKIIRGMIIKLILEVVYVQMEV